METLQDLQIGVSPISPPAPTLYWQPYIVVTIAEVYLWAPVWPQISKVYRELLTGSQEGCDLSHANTILEFVAGICNDYGSVQRCTMPLACPPRPVILPRVIPFMVRWLESRMLRGGGWKFREGKGFDTVVNKCSIFTPYNLTDLQHRQPVFMYLSSPSDKCK
jgi:hypothetical protein